MASQTPWPRQANLVIHVQPVVLLDYHAIDEIVNYIVDTRQQDNPAILTFPWPESEVPDLAQCLDNRLVELGQRKTRRFEYDYKSKLVYLDITGQSRFHYQIQAGLRDHLKFAIAELLYATKDAILLDRLQCLVDNGTASIKSEGETCQYVEEKAHQCIELSDGQIRAVLILDLQYKGMRKSWVSLFVADDCSGHWVRHSQLFLDDSLDQQPDGQVDLYLSDFLSPISPQAPFCRPSTIELATGVSSNAQVILLYEDLRAIVRYARHIHDPTQFNLKPGDKKGHPFVTAARSVTEVDQRAAEVEKFAAEVEKRLAEANQRVAEMQRRLADMDRWELATEPTAAENKTLAGQAM